jgi:very-short-patch-repair endonuclease
MRTQTKRKHFTKAERIFVRTLQELHVPFQAKVIISGREVDFIIGNYAIEIDGHDQDGSKNEMLVAEGYIPVHLTNKEVKDSDKLINYILWLSQIFPVG